ncbi:hypothetical protein ACO0RG_003703 [Hanseniaspora osmophila]
MSIEEYITKHKESAHQDPHMVDVPKELQEQLERENGKEGETPSSSSSAAFSPQFNEHVYIPGPVSMSEDVLKALGVQSQSHLGDEFATTYRYALQNLYKVVQLDVNSAEYMAGDAGKGETDGHNTPNHTASSSHTAHDSSANHHPGNAISHAGSLLGHAMDRTPSGRSVPPSPHKMKKTDKESTPVLEKSKQKSYQSFVLSGSGTLGFDLIATNLMVNKPSITKTQQRALVLSSGYFSENMYKCLKQYYPDTHDTKNYNMVTSNVDILYCPTGTSKFNHHELKFLLTSNNYQVITVTHVDTSTGVLVDLYTLLPFIREHAPNAFICVDAVCSLGVEQIDLNVLSQVDFMFSVSQKGLGCPPGLIVGYMGSRVLEYLANPDINKQIKGFYTNLHKWIPVWESYEYYKLQIPGTSAALSEFNTEKPKYFATPPTQLIHALNVSLKEILDFGIEKRCKAFAELSNYVKQQVHDLFGLELLTEHADSKQAAHGLTCVLYKNSMALVKYCHDTFKIDLAGPLLRNIKLKNSNIFKIEYFRIGHMSEALLKDFVENEHKNLDVFLKILNKATETVDLNENRKGYSSISLVNMEQ